MSTTTYRPIRYEQIMQATEGMDIRARRKLDSMCIYIGDKMFAYLAGDDIGLKLPQNDILEIIEKYNAEHYTANPGSSPLKEYVKLPKEILDDFEYFIEWVNKSITYTQSIHHH